jgi:proteasome lid subunit RPN8/RPN11
VTADLHRTKPLPTGPAAGRLVVPVSVLRRTQELLAEAGARRPAHEGMVWWAGRLAGTDTLVLTCIVPTVNSGPQHVFADEAAVRSAARATRQLRLGVVAQVHSHPGDDTRHSDGDDELVLMPFDGMFSVVVARYGAGSILPASGASVHQYQDGRWVMVSDSETALVVVPEEIRP